MGTLINIFIIINIIGYISIIRTIYKAKEKIEDRINDEVTRPLSRINYLIRITETPCKYKIGDKVDNKIITDIFWNYEHPMCDGKWMYCYTDLDNGITGRSYFDK